MKISSHQFLKAFLVGAGLIAILLAYRANSKNAAKKDLFFAGTGDISLRMPSAKVSDTIEMASPTVVADSTASSLDSSLLESEFEFEADDSELQLQDIEASAPMMTEQQWIEKSEAEAKVELEFTQIAQQREQDAFEEDMPEESLIPADVDESIEAQQVNFDQAAPQLASQDRPVEPRVLVPLNDAAALNAVHHIEYGKSLARRSATEAASQEFLEALRVLAESNDQASNGTYYIDDLRSGLLAMKEASDFNGDDPQRQITMNVASLIEGHETQIIGRSEARGMSASTAMKCYLEYAGIKLGACGGQNPVAAEALYCLGKMRSISAQANQNPESKELFEAIIFQHAALTADPKNHRSANELGVLLARNGQLAPAENYLRNSLQLKQTPQGWANLAKVHQRKGTPEDARLANLAIGEYQASVQRQSSYASPIRLVGTQEFIASSPVQHSQADPIRSQVVPVNDAPVSDVADEKPSFVQRIGSLFVPNESRR